MGLLATHMKPRQTHMLEDNLKCAQTIKFLKAFHCFFLPLSRACIVGRGGGMGCVYTCARV